jgi:hypothetical protein
MHGMLARSADADYVPSSMDLNDEQKAAIAGWVKSGMVAGDVQKRIKEEFGISLTYLDLRLLLDDLQAVPEEPEEAEPEPQKTGEAVEGELVEDDDLGGPAGNGRVSVSIDQITRPNALISGKVTFSDGQNAEWSLDTMGRLGLNPDTPGYRPSQDDVMAFQMELQSAARSAGLG